MKKIIKLFYFCLSIFGFVFIINSLLLLANNSFNYTNSNLNYVKANSNDTNEPIETYTCTTNAEFDVTWTLDTNSYKYEFYTIIAKKKTPSTPIFNNKNTPTPLFKLEFFLSTNNSSDTNTTQSIDADFIYEESTKDIQSKYFLKIPRRTDNKKQYLVTKYNGSNLLEPIDKKDTNNKNISIVSINDILSNTIEIKDKQQTKNNNLFNDGNKWPNKSFYAKMNNTFENLSLGSNERLIYKLLIKENSNYVEHSTYFHDTNIPIDANKKYSEYKIEISLKDETGNIFFTSISSNSIVIPPYIGEWTIKLYLLDNKFYFDSTSNFNVNVENYNGINFEWQYTNNSLEENLWKKIENKNPNPLILEIDKSNINTGSYRLHVSLPSIVNSFKQEFTTNVISIDNNLINTNFSISVDENNKDSSLISLDTQNYIIQQVDWYSINVDSNSMPTKIDGASGKVIKVDRKNYKQKIFAVVYIDLPTKTLLVESNIIIPPLETSGLDLNKILMITLIPTSVVIVILAIVIPTLIIKKKKVKK